MIKLECWGQICNLIAKIFEVDIANKYFYALIIAIIFYFFEIANNYNNCN